MSLFTSEPAAQNLPLYDTRKTFETSESEPLPTDASSEGSTCSEDSITVDNTRTKDAAVSRERNKDQSDSRMEKEGSVQSVKSYEECKECNGKVINDALSQENIALIKGMKSKEKKLKETRRQLNEERTFYEQQKMDLWKTITKKKSKSQIVQTEDSGLEICTVKDLESKIADLKKELEKETSKSVKFKERCESLKKTNGRLKSEISLNEEDYEKSWKEIQDKLEKYKKECGTAEKNSGVIKNVYDQVLKKNAYLARSNFALQAELRRLYRKFEHIDKPSIKKHSSKSTIQSASSPDLWRRHREESVSTVKKKMRRSKTAPCRSNGDESSENLVVSGSLISVHVEGEQKRLRPVFLVLDDKKKKKSSKVPAFGSMQECDEPKNDDLEMQKINNIESESKDTCAVNDSKIKPNNKKKQLKKSKTPKKESEINENLRQESGSTSKEPSKQNKEKKVKSSLLNELQEENEPEIKQTKPPPVSQLNEKSTKELKENEDQSALESGEPTDVNHSNNSPINEQKEEKVDENQFQLNDENSKVEAENLTLPEEDMAKSQTIKPVRNIKKHRTENIGSDSENCIIECQTHSSSIQ